MPSTATPHHRKWDRARSLTDPLATDTGTHLVGQVNLSPDRAAVPSCSLRAVRSMTRALQMLVGGHAVGLGSSCMELLAQVGHPSIPADYQWHSVVPGLRLDIQYRLVANCAFTATNGRTTAPGAGGLLGGFHSALELTIRWRVCGFRSVGAWSSIGSCDMREIPHRWFEQGCEYACPEYSSVEVLTV